MNTAPATSSIGLTRLVGWELMKIRTTRTWQLLLVIGSIMVVIQAGAVSAMAGSTMQPGQPPMPGLDDPAMLRTVYASGFLTGYLFTLVLGVLGITTEYRHKTITTTLLTVPRRSRVVVAKLGAYLVAGFGFGLAFLAVALVTAAVVISIRGYPLGLGASGVPRTLALSVLGCTVWTVFGLGLGTLVRNQIAAVVTAVGAVMLDSLLAIGLNQVGAGSVARFLPGQASSAISEAPASGGFTVELLPWWGGMATLCGYGLVLGFIGAILTLRRDVS
jgi:ABC-type transport system involved in multi-copper enzyme maturation permease subunit